MDFLETILVEKRQEIKNLAPVTKENHQLRPSFYHQVKAAPEKMHLIGEIKRASPSKGDINLAVDVPTQAKTYAAAGVSAISVLCDPVFFKGSIEDLVTVANLVEVPILCKDFIIDVSQLVRAKKAGASLVLLIVAALDKKTLKNLYQAATDLGLEVLVETHDAAELAIAHEIGAKIIGVNNRNLKTFKVDIQTSLDLAPSDSEVLYVSESGFKTGEDVARVKDNYQAVLVGETLMRAENISEKATELRVARRD